MSFHETIDDLDAAPVQQTSLLRRVWDRVATLIPDTTESPDELTSHYLDQNPATHMTLDEVSRQHVIDLNHAKQAGQTGLRSLVHVG